MRNLVSLLDTKLIDERGAGVDPGGGVVLSPSDGKVANPVELPENTFSRLFADDRVEAPGQIGNFFS